MFRKSCPDYSHSDSNSTSEDWAIAMISMFIVFFALIIVFPCVIYVLSMKEANDGEAYVGIRICNSCLCPCMFGVSAMIIICLIGLVMKPSGDLDLMPYAGYPGTIAGCIFCGIALIAPRCLVAVAIVD